MRIHPVQECQEVESIEGTGFKIGKMIKTEEKENEAVVSDSNQVVSPK